jgi:glycosyltransferase involved in cell wall biosynthesis
LAARDWVLEADVRGTTSTACDVHGADRPPRTDAVRCLTVSAPFSGIEVYFRNLQRVFSTGDDVDVVGSIWLRHRPAERLSRVPPLSLHWALSAWWSTTCQLRALRRRGVDADVILFNHLSPAVLLGRLPRRRALVLNLDATPSLVTGMGTHYLGRGARPALVERVKASLYRVVYRRASRVVATSQLVEHSLVESYGVDQAKVTVIPFSIDLRTWKRATDTRAHGSPIRILFVGGEFERKGGQLLLETASLPEFSMFEFHVVTKSVIRDAPLNVVIHRDLDPKSDALRELYDSASVFVLPTLADFSPIALCEAMAMELPVVATKVGAIDELVADDDNGYLVPPGDAEAFRHRVLELATSPELRRRMGARGRAIAERSFDLETNAARIAEVLRHARHQES